MGILLTTSTTHNDTSNALTQWRSKYAPEIIGESNALIEALEMAERVSKFDCPVLITGESGTGKELLAHAIHRASKRSEHAFIAVNCPAIPKDLVESELFGHAKGAFTGAVNAREGRFSAANRGTLFLDEIGEMTLDVQSKMLRTLQDFHITPVGEAKSKKVDVRIIAATNRDLEVMSESGEFRLDLFFRLNVVQIHLPSLAERRSDIQSLFIHHLDVISERLGVEKPSISSEIWATLSQAKWAGNIRQLRNLAERLVIMRGGLDVRMNDLPPSVKQKAPAERQGEHGLSLVLPNEGIDLKKTLREVESGMIKQALLAAAGNRNQAAKMLGLNRTTLVEKLRKQPELAVA